MLQAGQRIMQNIVNTSGNPPVDDYEDCDILVTDGSLKESDLKPFPNNKVNIRLWDYQVGFKGRTSRLRGFGAASSIGYSDGPGAVAAK